MFRLLLLLALAGCSTVSDSRLLPGVDTPHAARVVVVEHDDPGFVDAACRGLPGWMGILAAFRPVYYRGCAFYQRTPCVIHIVKGDKAAEKHERKHCEGYDHD